MRAIRGLAALTRFELAKALRWRWLLAVFALLALLVGMSALAVLRSRAGGDPNWRMFRDMVNASSFSLIMLAPSALVVLPAVIGVFSANSYAGEESLGQIRVLAARPVSRISILLSKQVAMAAVSYAALGFLLAISYGVGGAIFGFGGEVPIFEVGEQRGGTMRLAGHAEGVAILLRAYLAAGLPLISSSAMFLMFALVIRKRGNAIIAAIGLYFACFIIHGTPNMEAARPFLPTTYMMSWRHILAAPDWGAYLRDTAILVAISAGYLGVAAAILRKRPL